MVHALGCENLTVKQKGLRSRAPEGREKQREPPLKKKSIEAGVLFQ